MIFKNQVVILGRHNRAVRQFHLLHGIARAVGKAHHDIRVVGRNVRQRKPPSGSRRKVVVSVPGKIVHNAGCNLLRCQLLPHSFKLLKNRRAYIRVEIHAEAQARVYARPVYSCRLRIVDPLYGERISVLSVYDELGHFGRHCPAFGRHGYVSGNAFGLVGPVARRAQFLRIQVREHRRLHAEIRKMVCEKYDDVLFGVYSRFLRFKPACPYGVVIVHVQITLRESFRNCAVVIIEHNERFVLELLMVRFHQRSVSRIEQRRKRIDGTDNRIHAPFVERFAFYLFNEYGFYFAAASLRGKCNLHVLVFDERRFSPFQRLDGDACNRSGSFRDRSEVMRAVFRLHGQVNERSVRKAGLFIRRTGDAHRTIRSAFIPADMICNDVGIACLPFSFHI